MKTLKKFLGILGLCTIIIGVGGLSEYAHSSGVSGVPFNPIFGAITAVSETLTGASSAASYTATGAVTANNETLTSSGTQLTVNGSGQGVFINSATTPQLEIKSGSDQVWLADNGSGQGTLLAAGTNESLHLNANGTACIVYTSSNTAETQLPCTTASGAGNYVPTLKAAQTTQSGQMYAFHITNNGTTCPIAASSPGLPTGWSSAFTATGRCTITMPSVTNANSVISIPTADASAGADSTCQIWSKTATTIAIQCYTAGVATNDGFEVIIQDWN